MRTNRTILFASLFLFLVANDARAQDFDSKKIVPFVPSPQEVVDKMVDLAGVKKGDVVYDLGSGDGRIVVIAALVLLPEALAARALVRSGQTSLSTSSGARFTSST